MNETWGTKSLSEVMNKMNGVKANELRLGNWVRITDYYNTPINVEARGKYHQFTFSDAKIIQYLEPIPLSEELLLKYGFEKLHFVQYPTYKRNGISLTLVTFYDEDENGKETSFKEWKLSEVQNSNLLYYKSGVSINAIHQLQNLYFALVGEELNIK